MYALSAMHAIYIQLRKKKYNGQDELSWSIIQAIYFLSSSLSSINQTIDLHFASFKHVFSKKVHKSWMYLY